MSQLISAISEKLEFRGKPYQGLQSAIVRKESATTGAVDQKDSAPNGFAATVRGGFQSIA